VDASGVFTPGGVAVDNTNNRLYVADTENSRILGYSNLSTLSSGAAADIVIGQPDMNSILCNNPTTVSGTSTGGTSTTLEDADITPSFTPNQFVNFLVEITGGTGVGQVRTIISNTDTQLTVSPPWTTIPDITSTYQIRATTSSPSAKNLCHPRAVAVDGSGNLYVADTENNRVLVYTGTISTGMVATTVLGQLNIFGKPDFNTNNCDQNSNISDSSLCSPSGVVVDTAGNLYVADTGNNRVLEYDTPLTSDTIADRVFGQGNVFTTNDCNNPALQVGNLGPKSLCFPRGVALDGSDNLYVADSNNHRVLVYTTPLSTDTIADIVLGQADMNSNQCRTNLFGDPSNASLCGPQGLAVDSAGNLYVADTGNNRVLEYNAPLAVSGTSTGSNTSTTLNDTTQSFTVNQFVNYLVEITGGFGTGQVRTITGNTATQLTVSPPWTTIPDSTSTYLIRKAIADRVFGQTSFTTKNCNTAGTGAVTASTLCSPFGVALDGSNNLYIADTSNSRVLKYITPLTTDTVADVVLGQLAFTTNGLNFVDEVGLNTPKGVAVDLTNNRLYIADTENNRVLGYSSISALVDGSPASIVIGQADMNSNLCDKGKKDITGNPISDTGAPIPDNTTLCRPHGVAVDSAGNLYVADTGNNRVLEYNAPITTGMAASKVFGQGDLFAPPGFPDPNKANTCNNTAAVVGGLSAKSLCFPEGVAIDTSTIPNRLYIADTNNNRVIEYDTPLTSTTANRVFGEPDLNTNPSSCNNSAAPINGLSNKSLCFPEGVAVDNAGNLYVADTNNHRVLEYDTPLTNATADRVFGQPDFTHNAINAGNPGNPSPPSVTSLFHPAGVVVDRNCPGPNCGNLYVADISNNRVLKYVPPFLTSNNAANEVFGQPDFTSSLCNNSTAAIGGVSNKSLCFFPLIPRDTQGGAVTLDSSDNLYIADTGNHRILRFP